MPLDPQRVQAVFLSAVECDDPAARAAVLDRECSTDAELRQRVEALLSALDRPESLLDQPIVGPGSQGIVPLTGHGENGPDGHRGRVAGRRFRGGRPDDRAVLPDCRLQGAGAAISEMTNRAVPAIAGYEILGELGRGGMGVVYRARQVRLNRPCVLKMILAGAHASAEATVRFLAEAEAVARLQHPNIVQIHHIGEADGLPYFELEYVPGGQPGRRLDGTPWPARRAAELVEPLARGVAEAHRLGIVHRDLKPANILLAADGTPKLTDFGLAKSLASDSGLTRTDSIMGSPSYMAPEQAEGKTKQVGPLADVYALGAILYELLTGGPPFRGTTVLETLEQVKNAEPVPPSRLVPGLPRDVETIALKCLQKEPAKRYDSAAALAEDLRRFLGGEPIVARPVPIWERGWRWCRRNPLAAESLAGAAGIFLTAFVLVSWNYWRAEDSLEKEAKQRRAADIARDEAQIARDKAQRNEKAERWERYRSNIAAASAALQLAEQRCRSQRPRRCAGGAPQLGMAVPPQPARRRLPRAARAGREDQIDWSLSPSGRQVAVCCVDQNEVYLYDVATGRLDAVLRGHSAPATSVGVPSRRQASCYRRQRPDHPPLGSGDGPTNWPSQGGSRPANLDRDPGVAYNSDGSRIAILVDAWSGTSRLWDADTGKEIAVLAKWQRAWMARRASPLAPMASGWQWVPGSTFTCATLATGRQLAVLGPHAKNAGLPPGLQSGWQADCVRDLRRAPTPFTSGMARAAKKSPCCAATRPLSCSVLFSPDGSRLVSASDYPDNTARLWDAATGRLLAVLAGHKNAIWSGCLQPGRQAGGHRLDGPDGAALGRGTRDSCWPSWAGIRAGCGMSSSARTVRASSPPRTMRHFASGTPRRAN